MIRSQASPTSASCVTRRIVLPRSRLKRRNMPRTSIAARRVQVAGRLVAEDQLRVVHQGSGDRHALLLAAGQLHRTVAGPIGQADRRERLTGRGRAAAPDAPAYSAASATFSSAVRVGTRLNDWNTKPIERARIRVRSRSDRRRRIDAIDPERRASGRVGVRRVEQTEEVHQGALAGAGRPHDRDHLAGRDATSTPWSASMLVRRDSR